MEHLPAKFNWSFNSDWFPAQGKVSNSFSKTKLESRLQNGWELQKYASATVRKIECFRSCYFKLLDIFSGLFEKEIIENLSGYKDDNWNST